VSGKDDVDAVRPGDLYGGGIVAWVLQPGEPGYESGRLHGRVISLNDLDDRSVWSNVADRAAGTGTALDSGKSNTRRIVAQEGHVSGAAKLCRDYSVTVECSTYDDWYLPGREELERVSRNRGVLVKFAEGLYWSSSEQDSGSAWCRNLTVQEGEAVRSKSSEAHVRAMRSF
jgi:hypothetical protein